MPTASGSGGNAGSIAPPVPVIQATGRSILPPPPPPGPIKPPVSPPVPPGRLLSPSKDKDRDQQPQTSVVSPLASASSPEPFQPIQVTSPSANGANTGANTAEATSPPLVTGRTLDRDSSGITSPNREAGGGTTSRGHVPSSTPTENGALSPSKLQAGADGAVAAAKSSSRPTTAVEKHQRSGVSAASSDDVAAMTLSPKVTRHTRPGTAVGMRGGSIMPPMTARGSELLDGPFVRARVAGAGVEEDEIERAIAAGADATDDPADYVPKPIDTSSIKLSKEMASLVELLSKNTHDVWAEGKIKNGWRYAPSTGATEAADKTSNMLVPYEFLTEKEKAMSRNNAIELVKAMIFFGYKFELEPGRTAVDPSELTKKIGDDEMAAMRKK